ncbi:mannosyl-3-phosphoglycerate phosphatase [Pelagimonas varians]|uniref:Mannosyl-3-phosphoglycerate phosphatase n=2 Tax=Pelagimonas varians TaxID=696760 RepID=A0A238K9W7_9RHOB|nr:mannosyl-3-phosphoglycerate phosphatase [Pelagimonas varians]SMX38776.1 Putative mannosyl-3-phosphoglycerate phosphatase [Pelagimonas varians]
MQCQLRRFINDSMTATTDLIVFTDLDGTLIDHDTYDWSPAQPALSALKGMSAGVVLASSKTAAEIIPLRQTLGLHQWPAIVENGAGILSPNGAETQDASQYNELLSILTKIPPALRDLFRGFGACSPEQVIDMTGLTAKAAQLAKQRMFSEPGLWLGTDMQKAEFLKILTAQGVTAQQGGRFLSLSFGTNKVDQMRRIIETYRPKHTIALGDAPNDVKMLEHAEFGVVIANPHRSPLPPLTGEEDGHILRTKASGPMGWNMAIHDLLDRLELH